MIKQKTKEQCDKLLTPIVVKLHPVCLFYGICDGCTRNTQVAHHHCHKSKSLALRHDLKKSCPIL